MGFFPLYRDNLLTGPSRVSFAFPGITSNISKSLGATVSTFLLVPNVHYLQEFIQGNLGISDTMWKSAININLNSPVSSNEVGVFRKFAEVSGVELGDINKYKIAGKFKIPTASISIGDKFDGAGLKAFEKSTITSIFETQKPYFEIAKTVISLLVDIEDIVARVMPLVSANPLTHKSQKPGSNGGEGKRPKALGFQSGKDIKDALSKLDKLSKQGGEVKVNKDGSVTKTEPNSDETESSEFSDQVVDGLTKKYKIVSVQYSTIKYDPTVDYLYTYIDLPPNATPPVNSKEEPQVVDEDPYAKYKPKKMIFGIFDSKGVPVNPNDFLKTVGISNGQENQVNTNYKLADWITQSEKWNFRNSDYVWPSLGSPNYVYTNGLLTEVGKSAPSDKYSLKLYKEGDKNILTDLDAIPGDPVVDSFDSLETSSFSKYFTEMTSISLKAAGDLTEQEREESKQTIMSKINLNSHLENIFNYGQNKVSTYKSVDGKQAFPSSMKFSFKPYQIYVPKAVADEKLKGLDGLIWIDPEADYDMKIIRVDPVTKLKKDGAKEKDKLETSIKSFIKNYFTIRISDDSKFNIDINKNGVKYDSKINVNSYIIENWNYENSKVLNSNSFDYKIWSENPIKNYNNSFTWKKNSTGNYYDIEIFKSGNSWKYQEVTYRQVYAENPNPEEYFKKYGIYAAYIWVTERVVNSNLYGEKRLGDGRYVNIENGKIKKWYYDYNGILNSNTLPTFGKKRTYTLNKSTLNYSQSDIDIPIYQLRVTNSNNLNSVVIDPSGISNSFLSSKELFSKGKYGVGDPDNPQEIEVIERYQLTDLDTESYYIIEGIRVDDNQNDSAGSGAGGGSGSDKGSTPNAPSSSFYKLPHAIGVIGVFIRVLVKIFAKLVPMINSLLKLLKGPVPFIVDIISTKLGESFNFLSKSSMKAFSAISELSKKRDDILAKKGGAAFVNQINSRFKTSPLKDFVFVNEFGTKKSKVTNLKNFLNEKNVDSIKNNLSGVKLNEVGTNIVKNLTNNVASISSNLQGQAGNIVGNLQGQAGNIVGNLQGQAGNIVGNLQGQAGNIVGNLQGQAGNIVGNLQGQAGNIVGNLQGQAGNIVGNLQGQAGNIVGNLQGQAGNIVGNLQGQTGNILGNLQGQAGNIVGNLQGQAGNIVGNLQSKTGAIANNLGGITSGKGISSLASNKLNEFSMFGNASKARILKEVQGLGDFKCLLDGVGFIPFSIFGVDLSFGMELKFSNLIEKKPPIKFIKSPISLKSLNPLSQLNKGGNGVSNDSANSTTDQLAAGSTNTNLNQDTSTPNTIDKNPESAYKIISTWYSTGQFLSGVDYTYYYVNQANEATLDEVSNLESSDNPDDLLLAKEKIDELIKNSPFDQTLKNKLNELKIKLSDVASNTQPLLKLIMGLVTVPVQIIANIIGWLLDFFKSLTNPLALPTKILELLSFKWLLKFVTPKGILELLNIKFNPDLIFKWISTALMPGSPIKSLVNIEDSLSDKINQAKTTAAGKFDQLKNQSNLGSITSNASAKAEKIKGYLYENDYELADLSKFFSMPFLATLPVYTAGNFREMLRSTSPKLFNKIISQGTAIKNNATTNINSLMAKGTSIGNNLVNQGSTIASSLTTKGTGIANNLVNQGSTIAGNLQGQAGNIVGNLQGQATNIVGNLQGQATNIAGNLQGQAGNIVGNLQGQATNIAGNLQGQATNIVGNLQGQAGNIVGNLQGQATNIAGNLQGQAGNIVGNLQGQATNIAGNLQGQAGNIVGNLTNQGTNIANNLTSQGTNILNKGTNIANNLVNQGSTVLSSSNIADNIKALAGKLIPIIFKLPPFKLVFPSLCLIEKIINGVIDFIWSTLGLEILFKPPHLKICSPNDPSGLLKTLNGEKPSGDETGDGADDKTTEDSFVYEVKFPDGTSKSFLDREALDSYMEENNDVNFDIQF